MGSDLAATTLPLRLWIAARDRRPPIGVDNLGTVADLWDLLESGRLVSSDPVAVYLINALGADV